MLCGGAEGASHYIWAGFDAMRVLSRKFNDAPEARLAPDERERGRLHPGRRRRRAGAREPRRARARGARIRAEVLGVATNCGGHRGGGSMTAPNPDGRAALHPRPRSRTRRSTRREIDAISGHLTATGADPREVASWAAALGRGPGALPVDHATKSLIGHALGAAGAIESVAVRADARGRLRPRLAQLRGRAPGDRALRGVDSARDDASCRACA